MNRAAGQARAKAKRRTQASARAWELSLEQRRTAVIIYVVAGYEVEPAVHFLCQAALVRHWQKKSPAELGALIEQLFAEAHAADPYGLVALADTENPSDATAMRCAAACLEEWRQYRWGLRHNMERGVASSTGAMLQQLVTDRLEHGHDDPHVRGTTADCSARSFMARFRRRWGGRFGTIRECDDVSLDEVLPKACSPTIFTIR